MSVEFDENQQPTSAPVYPSRRVLGNPETPAMINGLKKWGIKESTAHYVLIAVIIGSIVLSGIILAYFVFGVGKNSAAPADPEIIRKMQQDFNAQKSLNEQE